MFKKILITVAIVAAGFATVAYRVNKTAEIMKAENDSLPEDEQLTDSDLGDALMGRFMDDVKANKLAKLASRISKDIVGMAEDAYEYRVRVALTLLVLGQISGIRVPIIAIKASWGILGSELVWRAAVHAFDIYSEDEV